MTPADLALLRGSSAHVVVDRVESPVLDDDAAHHVFRVLRVRDGELVTVTDGRGGWRPCRSVGEALEPDGDVRTEEETASPLTIAWAVPKRDKPEWIVQKLTELGVDRIVVLHAERSVVRWEGPRAERHLDRCRRVAVEAVQQSRGVWVPEVVGPVRAADVLPGSVAAEPGGRPLRADDRTIAIGPEGGWSADELQLAVDHVDLGERVLRVETAALVAAASAAAVRNRSC